MTHINNITNELTGFAAYLTKYADEFNQALITTEQVTNLLQKTYERESKACQVEVAKLDAEKENWNQWFYNWGRVELISTFANALGIRL